jgi:hypothetical protein
VEDLQFEEETGAAIWKCVDKMRHEISEQQWIEYLCGNLRGREPARLREHAKNCPECAGTLRDLSVWRGKLADEAALVRSAFETSQDTLDRLLADSLKRIREFETGADPSWTFREAVMLMRLLVEPFCGSGTAGATIHLAVQRSTPGAGTPATWGLFVRNMSEAMSSVCGNAAGRLVNQVGACLQVEGA